MTEAQLLDALIYGKKRTASTSSRKPLGHGEGGSFQGKSGSFRRSRKGVPRRLPNGRRQYIHTLGEWQAAGLCKGKDEPYNN